MEEQLKIIKSLAEKTRIRILALLKRVKVEVCVCEMVDALDECQYNVSRHLKVLQEAGLVIRRKKGKWTYYRLNEDHHPFGKMIIQALSHISSETIAQDLKRLQQRLSIRVNDECVVGVPKEEDR